ncbi:MAG: DNA polymerase I [Candidatus Binatia bacterium]|nr:MAG: DNA polymerase I [Candidatus Binatia bacterium]
MWGSERTLYLIDASSYVYRAFFALPRLTGPQEQPVQAVFGFTRMLLRLLRDAKPRYAAAVFDAPGPTFRDEIYADYKATRPPMPSELVSQLPYVREVAEACGLAVIQLPGVEADDVIATLASRWADRGWPVVIVSGDKDLLQLVGESVRVWDTLHDRWFDAGEVQKKFGIPPSLIPDFIALVGDSVDNIPGVKGIGEKSAQLLLRRYGSLEGILDHVAEIAEWKELRGARGIAAALQEQREAALLGRGLAVARRDVDLDLAEDDLAVKPADVPRLRRLFLRLGFHSLLRELPEAEHSVRSAYSVARDAAELREFLRRVPAGSDLALAVAGRGLDFGTALGSQGGPVLVIPSHVLPPRDVIAALYGRNGGRIVAHDFKYDLRAASAERHDTASVFDVMVAAYLLEVPLPTSLDEVANFYCGYSVGRFREDLAATASGLSVLPELAGVLSKLLVEKEMQPLFERVESPLVGVLARMEAAGMHVDTVGLQRVGQELSRRMERLTEDIYAAAGTPFNIASPQQLREILFDRLRLPTRGIRKGKTGLSTDVDALSKLAAVHPLPAKILEYRTLAKLRSTYVEGLLALVNPSTGRLHTTFNQCITATGRLSSTEPNLQNIPVRGEEGVWIRRCFTAPPGSQLVVADYSQIELRLLAHFSGDPVLCAAFAEQEDIHARTAAEVFGVPPSAVNRDQRRVAKMINFGVLYGMGAASLAKELGITVGEAQAYIDRYFARYEAVRGYLDAVVQQARERGYVTTLLGRRRSIPELNSSDPAVAQAAKRIAFNTPIQGSAADIIKVAMVELDREIRRHELPAKMVLQVHDELVFEVADPEVETMRKLAKDVMENVVQLRVPLVAEIGSGPNWHDAHP